MWGNAMWGNATTTKRPPFCHGTLSPPPSVNPTQRPAVGAVPTCSIIGMKDSTSRICALSSMIRLSYWKLSCINSRRLRAACVQVMATIFACLVIR